jgi:hypothetical protein
VVVAAASGSDVDADGFAVSVDDGPTRSLADGSAVVFAGLAPGSHSVRLEGVAGNCEVQDRNPRTVSVVDGAATPVVFRVTCTPSPSGSIVAVASVTGSDPDPDGFAVSVDDGPTRSLADGFAIVFADLAPGPHGVRLQGIAGNCEVQGGNPRSVSVLANSATPVVFTVTCVPLQTGTVAVRIGTPGFDAFAITVDETTVRSTTTGGVLRVSGLTPGVHRVRLQVQPRDCVINENNPQDVTVIAREVTDVSFTLTCPSGSLLVTVTTTGPNIPAAYTAYAVQMDDPYCYSYTCQYRNVNANGTARFDGLHAVPHYVDLRNLPSNCTPNPRSFSNVAISKQTLTQISFAVTCR